LVRQSGQNSPGAWTLFSGLTSEPLSSTNINWKDPYFQYDNLNVGFINSDTSKFTSTGNTQIVSLKNNSTASGYIYGQNINSGVSASTDITLNNNNNTAYIDMGINSSNFNGNSYQYPFTIAAANDSYIYSSSGSNNLTIGTQNSSGDLLLFTGGVLSGVSGNERVRVKSTGNVGIGVSTPNKLLTVAGDISATGNIFGNSYVNVLPASATSYQIAPTDSGTTIASLNNTTGLTATIVGTYPAGFQVGLLQLSTGRLNVNGGTNINQANGYFKTNKQYSAATLIYTGATAGWVLFGDLNS
jgi:hypothetical protein